MTHDLLFKPADRARRSDPCRPGELDRAGRPRRSSASRALQPTSMRSYTSTRSALWRPRRRSSRGRPRPSPASRSRSRTPRPSPACPTRWARTCSATSCPATTRTSRGASVTRGSSSSARRTCPSSGSCRSSEPRRFGPVAQPVGHRPHAGRLQRRRRRGGCERHGPARPRQRRRRLDPHPGRVHRPRRAEAHPRAHLQRARPGRRPPGSGRRPHPHRGGDRPMLDILSGYEVGDATWAPPPSSRSQRRRRGSPAA